MGFGAAFILLSRLPEPLGPPLELLGQVNNQAQPRPRAFALAPSLTLFLQVSIGQALHSIRFDQQMSPLLNVPTSSHPSKGPPGPHGSLAASCFVLQELLPLTLYLCAWPVHHLPLLQTGNPTRARPPSVLSPALGSCSEWWLSTRFAHAPRLGARPPLKPMKPGFLGWGSQ